MKHRSKIVGVALLCVAFGSAALTLGRARGAVLIGQPLEIVVQIQLDDGEEVSSLCFDADVFHADTRQDASRVRVVVEAITQSHSANLRVLSSALVDEPVVTVYLRSGCAQKTTRRYVLLADLPSEVAAPATPLVLAATAPAANSPAVIAVTPVAPLVAPVSPAKTRTVAAPKPRAGRAASSKRSAAKTAPASAKSPLPDKKSQPARPAGQSRLKLEHLELLSDRVANLDSFMSFAPSEDALLAIKKLQTLEADVKALRDSAIKGERSLVDLRARLQKAEAERFSSPLVYGLLALVVACLAALAWLWSRQRRAASVADDWWDSASPVPASAAPESGLESRAGLAAVRPKPEQVLAAREPSMATSTRVGSDPGRSSGFEAPPVERSGSVFSQLMQSGPADRDQPHQPALALAEGSAPTHTRLVRSLNSEAILDLRHQAEFFVSLGRTDEAVKLLKKQISESDEPNPFVYLDLLSIFHALGLQIEFQQYCQDFNLLFNGRVPEFAFFKDEGKGLESYPDVLSRITALWPAPKVLEVIEACIFRDPWAELSQPFDLAALRDLLLLHTIAQSIVLAPVTENSVPMAAVASGSAARANKRDRVDFDFEDSVSSTFPALSKSALADLFARESPPPQALDLDLSDLEMETSSARLPSADIDLARLLP